MEEQNLNRLRIMFVSDNFKYYTGFSYVMVSLMKRFAASSNTKDLCYVSMTNGKPELPDLEKFETGLSKKLFGMKIYDSNIEKEDLFTNFNLAINQFRPHIVITLNDPWRLPLVANSPFRDSFLWVALTSIETPEYPRTMVVPSLITNQPRMNIHHVLEQADVIIPCSEMGRKMLLDWYGDGKVTKTIPLGIDLSQTEGIKTTKAEAFSDIIPEDAFVFYSMGTNSPRKQMDRVVDAFAKFKETVGNPDKYFLCLHTGSNMILNGADIAEQIYKIGLQTSIYVSCTDSLIPADRKKLYQEYAASDCYIGLPGGEGFGYGFAEAIAFRKPVIYIGYGGHVEYCKGCGIEVPVASKYRVRNSNIQWADPDINAAAAAMRKMVSDKRAYDSFVAGTGKRRDLFNWSDIYSSIREIIAGRYDEHERTNLYGIPRRRI